MCSCGSCFIGPGETSYLTSRSLPWSLEISLVYISLESTSLILQYWLFLDKVQYSHVVFNNMRLPFVTTISALVVICDLTSAGTEPKKVLTITKPDAGSFVTGTGPVPVVIPYLRNPSGTPVPGRLRKRGYYTCFDIATTPVLVSDCEHVIDDIRAIPGNLTVPNGLCMVWYEGTCLTRFCAGGATIHQLNRTSGSVVDELAGTLMNDCVKQGQDGVSGDCANMNYHCGTYRLSLEHHGGEIIPGKPPTQSMMDIDALLNVVAGT
ncbi:hypothetical protein BJ170DRAFT_599735 [Xylariales sp. AK1849]|nr:hypothetical protein BJ170DRAFT_599735 [Xylariales sp. AK1849]